MHCTILALGSRGDIQPLLSLALGLKAAGFGIRFAAPADFENWVRELGLDYVRLTGNSSGFFGGPAGMALRERIRDSRRFARFFNDYLSTYLDKLLATCWEVCQDTDAILCWSWTRAGPTLAEARGVPLFVVSPTPVLHLPTRVFANPFLGPGPRRLGPLTPVYNRATWLYANPLTRIGQPQVDRWRVEKLGLPVLDWHIELRRLRALPHLLGYSPAVLPKPVDWGPDVHVTGNWFLDQNTEFEPSPELAAFLAAGEPPVAVGFSSQVGRNARRISEAVVAGLARSGRRGLLIAGWGGLRDIELPATVFRIDNAPYDWLLPRLAALVHQGGAGSVASALRVGLPNMAVPFGYDQALWGGQVAALGAGLPPIPVEELTADALAGAIQRLADDERLRAGARRVAQAMAGEDGVATAVGIIERTLATRRSASPTGAGRSAAAR